MDMAIIDKPPTLSLSEGNPELLRHLHQNPEAYSFVAPEQEPIQGIEAIASFAGQLVALNGTAIEFISRLGYHLRLSQPQSLDSYPTIIQGTGPTRAGLATVTFCLFNNPPFGRGELVTAYAHPNDRLAVRPIHAEYQHP